MELSDAQFSLPIPETLADFEQMEREIMAREDQMSEDFFRHVRFLSMVRRAHRLGVLLVLLDGCTLPQLQTLVGGLEGLHTARAAIRSDERVRSILSLTINDAM